MAIRFFGSRTTQPRRTDPIRIANAGRDVKAAPAAKPRVTIRGDWIVADGEGRGNDPYNSTGRITAESLRKRRFD